MKKMFLLFVFFCCSVVYAEDVFKKNSETELFVEQYWRENSSFNSITFDDNVEVLFYYFYGRSFEPSVTLYYASGDETTVNKNYLKKVSRHSYFRVLEGNIYAFSDSMKTVLISENNEKTLFEGYSDNNRVYETKKIDNKLFVLRIPYDFSFDNIVCSLDVIESETVSSMDCNYEVLKTYFPEVIYEYENDLVNKEYAVKDSKFIVVNDNALQYFDGEKLIFEKTPGEGESFTKVGFLKDKIIAIKEKIIYHSDLGVYSDQILVYDLEGNILQTIADNSSYIDFSINKDENKIVVFKKYLDGICKDYYEGHYACNNYFSYDIYELIEPKDNSDVLDSIGNIISNPNTKDMAILVFISLFIASLIVILKNRKIDF